MMQGSVYHVIQTSQSNPIISSGLDPRIPNYHDNCHVVTQF